MAKIPSTTEKSLNTRLGSDCTMPLAGDFVPISGVDLLLQDMQILLLTMTGERVFRPDYGCGLRLQVWENIQDTATNGASTIQSALAEYEPRITVLGVTSDVNENSGLITFNIQFQINSTDSVYNLIFPYRSGTQLSLS